MVFVDETYMFGFALKKTLVTAQKGMREARFRSQQFN